jgi:hypothetical protein
VVDPKPQHVSGVEESDPDTVSTVLIGLIGTVLLIAAVALLQGLFNNVERKELRKKVVETTPQELQNLRIKQIGQLRATAWVDQAGGVVSIPVERAMEMVVRDPAAAAVPPPAPPKVAPPQDKK